MDFVIGLPLSQGNNAIWVIVDRLTKRAHFIPIFMGDNESSAKECAKLFCRRYQVLHGIPEEIVSDRDVRFTSVFWQEFMKLQGTVHNMSSAFKPSTDGQSERTNRFLEDYLRNYVHPCQDDWAEFIFVAEVAYNSRVQDSIKMSPFEADIGYVPKTIPDQVYEKFNGSKSSNKDVYLFAQRQQEILERVKVALIEAQARMKKYYDKKRLVQKFKVGDEVFISSKNLDVEHLGVISSGSKKLAPLWIGPYSVLKEVTRDTYKIKLPLGLRLHPEFHTSLLKPYKKDHDPERLNRPNEGMIVACDGSDGYLVENIVGHRKRKGCISYQVKWLGYPLEYNTWEPVENLLKPARDMIESYLAENGLDSKYWIPRKTSRR